MNDDLDGIEQAREREHYSLDPRDQPFAEDEPEAEEDERRELLDAFDIAALNAARDVLQDLSERCKDFVPLDEDKGWLRDFRIRGLGNIEGRAEEIGDSIFQLLNTAKHHLDVLISDGQLHNRKPEDVA